MGNYYSVNQPTNLPSSSTSGSRISKRLNNNFLENLERANLVVGSNVCSAESKKRNKSINKSYNNND